MGRGLLGVGMRICWKAAYCTGAGEPVGESDRALLLLAAFDGERRSRSRPPSSILGSPRGQAALQQNPQIYTRRLALWNI